jgi:hypothetical protein
MHGQLDIEFERQAPSRPAHGPNGTPAPAGQRKPRRPTRAQQVDAALRNALWQWFLFTGVIGVSLLALVLTLKA